MSRNKEVALVAGNPLPAQRVALLKPRVHGLALQCQNSEHTLVDTPQRLALNESLETSTNLSAGPHAAPECLNAFVRRRECLL